MSAKLHLMRRACARAQHVAETEDEREKRYQREYSAYVHAPPKEGDYRVTRMEPTPEGAEHAGAFAPPVRQILAHACQTGALRACLPLSLHACVCACGDGGNTITPPAQHQRST